MKKTISLVLVLAFMFSLAINLPVLAEDNTGVATFNWIVDMKTTPGTYAASIFGGGYTLNTTHIVLP